MRSHRIGVVLLADGIGLHQRFVALHQGCSLGHIGFGTGLARARTGYRSRVGSGVYGKQRLTCLNITAFAKKPLLQDAGRACTHLGDARRFESPGQLGEEPHILLCDGDHADLRRRRRSPSRRVAAFATARQRERH